MVSIPSIIVTPVSARSWRKKDDWSVTPELRSRSASGMKSSAPIDCVARSGDLESGLLVTRDSGVLTGIGVTPIQTCSSVEMTRSNLYSRSVPAPGQSPRSHSGFIENLRRRTRQRSINIPSSADFDLSQDLGYPPVVENPPSYVVAASAPDGGGFLSFRSRSKSEAFQPMMSPRRHSGVLVFFPSSPSAPSTPAVAAAASGGDPLSLSYLPPTPVSAGPIPVGRGGMHSKSFDGPYATPSAHLPIFSASSTSSSASTDIQRAEEGSLHGGKASPRRPLYVDTALANQEEMGMGERRRSPMAHVVDFVRNGGSARIRTSSLTSPSQPQPISARGSCSAEMANSPLRSPSVRTPSGRPPLYRYSRLPQQQRSLDSGLDLTSPSSAGMYGTALLIKEATFFSSFDSMTIGGAEISTVVLDNQDAVYSLFMKAHKCYDLIPVSTKLVVFDTHLPVRKAFYALVYNGVRAAPLWDNDAQLFSGMLTITDFIKILYRHHEAGDSREKMAELEDETIATWRKTFAEEGPLRPLVAIDPNESLYRAVQLLCESHVHRLPVMDRATGNISYILTHKRIIKFLSLYLHDLPRPAFMEETPRSLGIGSWGEVLSIHADTKLIDALKIFLENRVSALPIVDDLGKVVDIYAKFDVIALAAEKVYDKLEITVHEALKHRQEWFEGVRTCRATDSLFSVLETIVKAEVHRLIVVDEADAVVGIVALSDILKYLVLDRCVERTSCIGGVSPRGGVDSSHSSSSAMNGMLGEMDPPVFDVLEEEEHRE